MKTAMAVKSLHKINCVAQPSKWEKPRIPQDSRSTTRHTNLLGKRKQWDHWLRAMMMDTRLCSRDKVVLTALANHYNLKTGEVLPRCWQTGH